jgi:hypothetical protein
MPREIEEAQGRTLLTQGRSPEKVSCPLEVPSTTLQDHGFANNDDAPMSFASNGF